MKPNVVLTFTSLLAILFTTLHLTHDIVLQVSPGGITNLPVVLVLAVWLCGTVALDERRSGYVIVLVLSLLASALPVVHMMGGGITGGASTGPVGGFFFAWTLLALDVTALSSVILAARALWNLRRVGPK